MPQQVEIVCISRPTREHLRSALNSYFADIINRQEMARRSKDMYLDLIDKGDYESYIVPIQGEEHARELIDIEDWIIADSDRVMGEISELSALVEAAPDCETNGGGLVGGDGSSPWFSGFEES